MTTQTVCLFVAMLSGLWCYPDASPIGRCWQGPYVTEEGNQVTVTYCKVDNVTDLPLRAQWYDPELGGINCAPPCDTMANGEKVADWYNQSVALPANMVGHTIFIEELGEFVINDTGGGIHPRWACLWVPGGYECMWYIPADFLVPLEAGGDSLWWMYLIFDDWSWSGEASVPIAYNTSDKRRGDHE